MQKVINVLAVLSFVGTTSILATSGYVYWRRDAIADQVTETSLKQQQRQSRTHFLVCLTLLCLNFLIPLVVLFLLFLRLFLSDMKKLMMALAAALIGCSSYGRSNQRR